MQLNDVCHIMLKKLVCLLALSALARHAAIDLSMSCSFIVVQGAEDTRSIRECLQHHLGSTTGPNFDSREHFFSYSCAQNMSTLHAPGS